MGGPSEGLGFLSLPTLCLINRPGQGIAYLTVCLLLHIVTVFTAVGAPIIM